MAAVTKDWFTSSACGANNSCVEVQMRADGSVAVRNSTEPESGTLQFTPQEWTDFLAGARNGEFDLA